MEAWAVVELGLSMSEVRELTIPELSLLEKHWRMKLRREYYIQGRPSAFLFGMLDNIRRVVLSAAGKYDSAISCDPETIFPEIETLNRVLKDERESDDEEDTEKEKEEDTMGPGTSELLLKFKSGLLKERLTRLEEHRARVAKLKETPNVSG